ncbi:MAG: flagellar basal body rod protein FlgB [Sporolactobacillus sp.]|jgi:flagellar basal-body rod protein FlgB|nr:flagellar basal body rod protein FlgB [Sporolactobacillus sp.]
MMFSVTPTALSAIERSLNASMATQNTISQNIANIDTPGYKAKKVVFNDTLQQALKAHKTSTNQLDFSTSPSDYRVVTDTYGTLQNNGNNVDIDHEMSELAQNQLLYQTLTQSAADQFKRFNIVLGGAN